MDFTLRPWSLDDLDNLVHFAKALFKNGEYLDAFVYAIRREN